MKIENRGEHHLALAALERAMAPLKDDEVSEAGAWVEVLGAAIEQYELEHFPIGRPDRWLCACGAREEPVLNKRGDDIACAVCGSDLVVPGVGG